MMGANMERKGIPYYCTIFGVTAVVLAAAVACSPGGGSTNSEMPGGTDAIGAVSPVTVSYVEDLLKAAGGKVTVVNFWATWCPPCVAEMPELAAFYRQHARDRVAFIALSLDAEDEIEETVKPFMKERNIPFPVYVLAERDIEAISKAVRAEISGALPVTLVYDKGGNVKKMWEGAITLEELNEVVKPLL